MSGRWVNILGPVSFQHARFGVEGVVPFAVPVVSGEGAVVFEGLDLLVGDFDAGGVAGGVELGVDVQAGAGSGGGDGVDDDFVAGQGPAAPVHRDVGEEPVFDFVPFAGARREVAHGDGEPGLGCRGGQLGLPLPGAVAVGPAAVGGDQQPARVRVAGLAGAGPPGPDRVDRER